MVAFEQNQRDELRETPHAGALKSEPGMHNQTFIAVQEQGGFGVRQFNDGTVPTLNSESGSHQGGPMRLPLVMHATKMDGFDGIANTFTGYEGGPDARDLLENHLVPMDYDQTVMAFALRGRNGGNMPEAQSDGVVSGLRGSAGGSTRDMIAWREPSDETVYSFTERTRDTGLNLEASEEIVNAITSPGDGGRTTNRQIASAKMGVRRLTPVECERLQSYPDDWTRWALNVKPSKKTPSLYIEEETGRVVVPAGTPALEQSDTNRYRQCGNGVTSNVAYFIARRLYPYVIAESE